MPRRILLSLVGRQHSHFWDLVHRCSGLVASLCERLMEAPKTDEVMDGPCQTGPPHCWQEWVWSVAKMISFG